MKIAFLIDQYVHPRAGTEGQLHHLVSELQQRGHSVRLGVLRATDYTERGRFPAPVDNLDIPRIRRLRGWFRLYRWAQALVLDDYRVVQILFNDAAVIGPWPLRLAGLKVIVTRRDMGFWCTPSVLLGLRLAAPAVSVLVANSYAAGRAACRREWLPVSRLRTIQNGVPDLVQAQHSDGVPQPPLGGRIGIVANIRPVKRLEDLVAAFGRVVQQHRDVELVIIGGGDSEALRAQAQTLGIADRVRFTGQLADPGLWIRTFTVGVLCSESEGLSNVILEYMQAGVPVVATHTGGNPELVAEGETGWLVPVGDTEAMSEALSRLLSDPQAARRMGKAGRDRVQRSFSLGAMVEAHLLLYRTASGVQVASSRREVRG